MKVVAGRLPRGLCERLGDVEHVVDELEAHPDVQPEVGERLERFVVDSADHASDRDDVAMSDAVFPSIDEVARLTALRVEQVLELQHLPRHSSPIVDARSAATSAPSDAASNNA